MSSTSATRRERSFERDLKRRLASSIAESGLLSSSASSQTRISPSPRLGESLASAVSARGSLRRAQRRSFGTSSRSLHRRPERGALLSIDQKKRSAEAFIHFVAARFYLSG